MMWPCAAHKSSYHLAEPISKAQKWVAHSRVTLYE
jgi:hypothetical protein